MFKLTGTQGQDRILGDRAELQPPPSRLLKVAAFIVRAGLLLAVAGFLFIQLSKIGWGQVLISLPDQPVFYLLIGLHFMLIPTVELMIFAPLWRGSGLAKGAYFQTFLRKQALNDTVIGYSGDAYLLWWGRRQLGLNPTWVFHTVKDTTLLSAACSSMVTLLVASVLFFLGYLDPLLSGLPDAVPLLLGGLGAGALVIPLLALLGRRILGLPGDQIRRVCKLHVARQAISEGLLILQWSIALPNVPFSIWLALSAARMVITRVPMMPNKELTMLALALGLSQQLEQVLPSAAALAGLFLARATLIQLLNAGVLIVSSASVVKFRSAATIAGGDDETAGPGVPDQSDGPSGPVHSSG